MSEILCALFLIVGSLFMLLAGIGIVRMPDLFMRMQAATKAATLGAGCMLVAVAIFFGGVTVPTRALLVIAFVFLTAPVAAHMIGRAAYSVGVPLWRGTIVDEVRGQGKSEGKAPEETSMDAPPRAADSGPTS